MRVVIYAWIFLFIFGTAWILYLDNQNKNFIESLPQPPFAAKTETVDHTANDTNPIETVERQKIQATEPPSDLIPEVPHVHPHRPIHRHAPHDGGNDLTKITPLRDEKLEVVASADEKLDEDLARTPDFDLEKIRQGLIHEFGNIHEVDILMQHMPAEIKEGEVVRVQKVTPFADVLEYHKAIATLWPTPENLRAVERTKELLEWRGGPLPSWVNPEHVRYTDE